MYRKTLETGVRATDEIQIYYSLFWFLHVVHHVE